MKKILFYLFVLFIVAAIVRGIHHKASQNPTIKKIVKTISDLTFKKKSYETYQTDRGRKFIQDSSLYKEKWDQLAQPIFWQKAMDLEPEKSIMNVAATREILTVIPTAYYMDKNRKGRNAIKDSLRTAHDLDKEEEIYVTSGKNHFYQFDKVYPNLEKGIKAFVEQGVDPWYAQAILLIESPNKLQESPVGAYGAFQLMKNVAIKHGLTVNSLVDERKNLKKSAVAASKLIKTTCIPHAERILDKWDIPYSGNELWFKLVVLHIYHAGAGNVGAVVDKIKPKRGGMELIQQLWKTQHKRFKNASQNYSQIALASAMILNEMIEEKYQTMPVVVQEN